MLGNANASFFLHHLFLRRLLHRILAPADTSMELVQVADMEVKVMEVATPTISVVSDTHNMPEISGNSEVRQL